MLARQKYGRMRWGLAWPARCAAFWLLLLSLVFGGAVIGQELNRKVIARTAPSYPELARRMHLKGKVKLEVVIAPEGSVKSAKMLGGSPVFEKSAVEAVKQWRFEAAAKETQAVILLEFAEP
jgi:TonB family protein